LHKGELASVGALREVTEETGVKNLKIIHSLPGSWHMYSFANEWVVKKTHWYLMRSNFEGVLKPQSEERILAAIWIPQYTLPEYMGQSYGTLRDVVDYILQHQLFDEY
jgi:ADP-ribose pyrophosphatase YjhB (NUDIX family)